MRKLFEVAPDPVQLVHQSPVPFPIGIVIEDAEEGDVRAPAGLDKISTRIQAQELYRVRGPLLAPVIDTRLLDESPARLVGSEKVEHQELHGIFRDAHASCRTS